MTVNKNNGFSAYNRTSILEEMASDELDLLVVGGGITGCGIALDAALRGLRVGLVEMQDFAAGTSSRSTKLIHGGLRYLKQGEINLVREVGHERAILYRNAPHVVKPEPMLLPLVKGGTFGKLGTSLGLWLYDRLAGVDRAERRRMLSKRETQRAEPLLNEKGLKGSGLYVEYRTDDARLTIEVIKTAVLHGAMAVNYSIAREFLYENGTLTGALVEDIVHQKKYALRAKKIVNATGPWVDGLRHKDQSLQGKRLHLTKGVHIVVDHSRFPLQQAIYFDVDDKRMIFAIPRDGKTYIGTTDTNYDGDLVDPRMTEGDLNYLIKATNGMFPSLTLTVNDVESHWVGLRPLIHEDGKSPSELSRKDEIFRSRSGLITIAGGKLTGFRKMAERVVDLVAYEIEQVTQSAEQAMQKKYPQCLTANQVLSGGNVGGPLNWEAYRQENVKKLIDLSVYEGVPNGEERAKRFIQRYGSNVDQVLAYLLQANEMANKYGVEPIWVAELMYGVEHEMVVTAEDFLARRTGDAYFNIDRFKHHKTTVQCILEEYANQIKNSACIQNR
jgi:glycerol-3-phosphate dehydrogenase